jgi:polyisoprenoid-binding protein YceI
MTFFQSVIHEDNMLTKTKFVIPFFCLALVATSLQAQNFKVPAKGVQTFGIKDQAGRNQAIFYSKTTLEDITGTASGLSGTVSFDPANVAGTIKAEIAVDITSMKTGIAMRDEHMQGEKWLNAAKYPTIVFSLKKLKNAKSKTPNSMEAVATGDFSMRGVTKSLDIQVTLTYLTESEQTKKRAPGDLLGIRGRGKLSLTDFGIKSEVVGLKVSDRIEFELNAVGSNAGK